MPVYEGHYTYHGLRLVPSWGGSMFEAMMVPLFVPEEQWTEAIKHIVAYARFLAHELMGVQVVVSVVRTTHNFVACYGQGRLDFNLFRLGHKWFEQGITEEVDSLLIHEFGHQYSGDHLSEEYHEALCRLGARLKRLALERPEALRQFTR